MDKVQTCQHVLRKLISDGDLFLKGQMPSERRLTDVGQHEAVNFASLAS